MRLEEVLQMIDEMIALHVAYSMFESTNYHKGAFEVLEDLRDAIKQKGGEE